MEKKNDYAVNRSRRPWLCRWWLRARRVRNHDTSMVEVRPGMFLTFDPWEFYIPWWAWPLELTHRAIFGRPKILMRYGKTHV